MQVSGGTRFGPIATAEGNSLPLSPSGWVATSRRMSTPALLLVLTRALGH